MPALEAYAHSVENVVFVEIILNKNAYVHSVENVTPVAPERLSAYAHSNETVYVPVVLTVSRDATAYAYDQVFPSATPASRDATAYAYDHVFPSSTGASRDATAYAYDNVITQAHPGKLWVYNGTTSTWERVTIAYTWTGTTWQAVL